MARSKTEINASSMADIAFLLLIFFLVTTTIDSDKGLTVKLPPMPEDDQIIDSKQNKRNVLNILVNARDQMLVNDELTDVKELKDLTMEFVNNNGVDPKKSDSPDKAVISLKNDKGTKYSMYISVHNELKAAYNEMWNKESRALFGKVYDELDIDGKKEVRKKYPYKISEAEPEDNAKK